MFPKKSFALNLIRLRKEHNLTLKELADKTDISNQSLSAYEKEERTASIEVLFKVADFFKVSCDYLLGNMGETEEQLWTSKEEKKLIMYFRNTDDTEKEKIIEYAEMLYIKGNAENENREKLSS